MYRTQLEDQEVWQDAEKSKKIGKKANEIEKKVARMDDLQVRCQEPLAGPKTDVGIGRRTTLRPPQAKASQGQPMPAKKPGATLVYGRRT